jgi:hypothetical protein
LAPIDVRHERYCCPGCGSQVRTTFHDGLDGTGDRFAGHIVAPRTSVETAPKPMVTEAFYPVPFF